MEVDTTEQLLTDKGHNSPPISHSPGGKRSTKTTISWTSLVHILAPPIVSTVRPTPKYPNWTADSCRGRNSSLAHPHIPLPFYLLYVFKTWRYSEKKQEHSRGFSGVCGCNELQLTSQCVFDSSFSLKCFLTYVSSVYPQTYHVTPQKELFISQNLFGDHLCWKNFYQNPLFDSKLYLSLKRIKIKLNFHQHMLSYLNPNNAQ